MQVSGFKWTPDWQQKLDAKRDEKWKRECSYESGGNMNELSKCFLRKKAEWDNMILTEKGSNCISAAAGDIDKTLACGASSSTNYASSVTFNVFLGAILATVLLVRAS